MLPKYIAPVERTLVRKSDSYKYGHFLMLPPDAKHMSFYMEARGGPFAYSRFFGLQAILKQHFLNPVTSYDVEIMEIHAREHGISFNKTGWMNIVKYHNGLIPVEIEAVPEGLDIPIHNVVMQFINTDPKMPWLPGFLETILEQVWAPTTLATDTAEVRRMREKSLARSSDNLEAIDFSLHDFGYRAVASDETAGVMGSAHLLNFLGTDTMPALDHVRKYYNEEMAGFSIDAGEHSTVMAWKTEEAYFEHIITNVLKPNKIVAAPIDTHDWRYTLRHIVGGDKLRERIMKSNGKFVVRPDSGDPVTVVPEVLQILAERFGYTINSKGFKVLPQYIGAIFGDGLTLETIELTEESVMKAGFSTENIVYGRGSGGLQVQTRDRMGWAIKANAIEDADGWRDLQKTTPGKQSKAGRLALVREDGIIKTIRKEDLNGQENLLRTVYKNGSLIIDEDFATIRARARTNKN